MQLDHDAIEVATDPGVSSAKDTSDESVPRFKRPSDQEVFDQVIIFRVSKRMSTNFYS